VDNCYHQRDHPTGQPPEPTDRCDAARVMTRRVQVTVIVGSVVAAGVIVAAVTVAAVDEHRRTISDEIASSACHSALRSRASRTEAADLDVWHSQVTRQGPDWRVEGQLPSTGRDATCLVVSDPTDHLRGVRVDSIRLTPATSG